MIQHDQLQRLGFYFFVILRIASLVLARTQDANQATNSTPFLL